MSAVSDLAFFAMLVKHGSMAAVAREMGVTPPVISKTLASLEARLGVRLLNRSTRRMSVTQEGELYFAQGSRILAELEELESTVAASRAVPRGLLRVNASIGFGRRHIGPAITAFVRDYPEVEVQLQVSDRPANLADTAFDVGIRIGALPDARLYARRIAANERWLCAAPQYLRGKIPLAVPRDLARHQCIVLRENDAAYGHWTLYQGRTQESVKVRGKLSTNHGEIALDWALDGQGIVQRSQWDVAPYLRSGRLVRVLPEWSLAPADIFAVYPEKLNLSARVTAFIDFLQRHFATTARQDW
ncbi:MULTISPECIES: LysR family transcriptional regulator [unclassified Janthinobacterium]|uniref:LysR family transcriptional regulator n=1 Tax=unclassified Janthinobacterium TaxID=2610881 RepID=UPI001611C69D|nr:MULTISPECIES: LysR family transcriptional regulator [unclassified Janthinobacterium]MBB5368434.1 DNA-binding transcriptional LysR family regulator [Janthinobacterium sp. K2C7]MBB5382030.1 DNA-binding transcriptional LysR family regulator [Janthinobacterium sp. K2Li3]MBB5386816.1 DNA-binding transcriptional LysR family regulator [Janthinobacterium sp. K2E3]